MPTRTYNPSVWKTEAGGLSEFPAWPKSETVSQEDDNPSLGKAEASQVEFSLPPKLDRGCLPCDPAHVIQVRCNSVLSYHGLCGKSGKTHRCFALPVTAFQIHSSQVAPRLPNPFRDWKPLFPNATMLVSSRRGRARHCHGGEQDPPALWVSARARGGQWVAGAGARLLLDKPPSSLGASGLGQHLQQPLVAPLSPKLSWLLTRSCLSTPPWLRPQPVGRHGLGARRL